MKWQIDYGERPWRRWFAWYPVRFDGSDTRAWLEWVERKTWNAQGYIIHRHRALSGVPEPEKTP